MITSNASGRKKSGVAIRRRQEKKGPLSTRLFHLSDRVRVRKVSADPPRQRERYTPQSFLPVKLFMHWLMIANIFLLFYSRGGKNKKLTSFISFSSAGAIPFNVRKDNIFAYLRDGPAAFGPPPSPLTAPVVIPPEALPLTRHFRLLPRERRTGIHVENKSSYQRMKANLKCFANWQSKTRIKYTEMWKRKSGFCRRDEYEGGELTRQTL